MMKWFKQRNKAVLLQLKDDNSGIFARLCRRSSGPTASFWNLFESLQWLRSGRSLRVAHWTSPTPALRTAVQEKVSQTPLMPLSVQDITSNVFSSLLFNKTKMEVQNKLRFCPPGSEGDLVLSEEGEATRSTFTGGHISPTSCCSG